MRFLYLYRYEQLLVDCHQCYFTQRLSLLTQSVTSAVHELAAKHQRDHCALVCINSSSFLILLKLVKNFMMKLVKKH